MVIMRLMARWFKVGNASALNDGGYRRNISACPWRINPYRGVIKQKEIRKRRLKKRIKPFTFANCRQIHQLFVYSDMILRVRFKVVNRDTMVSMNCPDLIYLLLWGRMRGRIKDFLWLERWKNLKKRWCFRTFTLENLNIFYWYVDEIIFDKPRLSKLLNTCQKY